MISVSSFWTFWKCPAIFFSFSSDAHWAVTRCWCSGMLLSSWKNPSINNLEKVQVIFFSNERFTQSACDKSTCTSDSDIPRKHFSKSNQLMLMELQRLWTFKLQWGFFSIAWQATVKLCTYLCTTVFFMFIVKKSWLQHGIVTHLQQTLCWSWPQSSHSLSGMNAADCNV